MNEKIKSLDELVIIRTELQKLHKKIVFTNGCFDIIHRGHVEYLRKAKELGDVLVVALNTDAGVRRLKGKKRPVVHQDDRAVVMASLEVVDYVTFFDEDTPIKIITALVPDVLVKGGDWAVEEIVGKDVVEAHGGRVEQIRFVEGRSTTNIIQKIIESYGDK